MIIYLSINARISRAVVRSKRKAIFAANGAKKKLVRPIADAGTLSAEPKRKSRL
jgi:hypothetical protein